jgi:hypothetical protein
MVAEYAAGEKCFVIMPFKSPFDEYYSDIYRPAIEDAGLVPVQSGEIFSPGMFMRQVVEGIRASIVVLAELTGRNANVFYELGLAHAYRKPVIMLTQSKEDVPSDLQGLRWIGYQTLSPRWVGELRQSITEAIASCTQAGAVERTRRFLPAAVETIDVREVADRVVDLTPTQRRIFEFIRLAGGEVSQTTLGENFQELSSGDLYYRLETLRLSGIIESRVIDRAGTRYPLYAYRLSPEVSEFFARRFSNPKS